LTAAASERRREMRQEEIEKRVRKMLEEDFSENASEDYDAVDTMKRVMRSVFYIAEKAEDGEMFNALVDETLRYIRDYVSEDLVTTDDEKAKDSLTALIEYWREGQ
jgi:hypothetical protein